MTAPGMTLARRGLRPRLVRSLPALLWMALIFYWSSQPSLPIDAHPQSALLHRLAHVLVYAVLGPLVRLAVDALPAPARLAFVISLAYGVSDEVHQAFVPGRTATLRDVLLDGASAGVALALLTWAQRRTGSRGDGERAAGGPPRAG